MSPDCQEKPIKTENEQNFVSRWMPEATAYRDAHGSVFFGLAFELFFHPFFFLLFLLPKKKDVAVKMRKKNGRNGCNELQL